MAQILKSLLILFAIVYHVNCQTPVIGGSCKLGTADVQIGGKQTQFFLKCEAASDSADGEGVWVVKSRAASSSQPAPAPAPEQLQPQQRPPSRKLNNPNICEQDNGARETASCAVSATCLQANLDYPTTYLQCDQTLMQWTKKSCQDGFIFNFEQQTCIVPKRTNSFSRKQANACEACPLGTLCRNQTCLPLTASTLCATGAPPSGNCPCSRGWFCTSQGVCCPHDVHSDGVCRLPCSFSRPCPNQFTCSISQGCCYHRSLTKHLAREASKENNNSNMFLTKELSELFTNTNELFTKSKDQPRRPFQIMNERSGYSSVNLALDSDEPESAGGSATSTSTTTASKRPMLHKIPNMKLQQCQECPVKIDIVCHGTNAVCISDDECPPTFQCENSCCRLAVCPSGPAVRFTCNTNYQCGAREKCIFGACCPVRGIFTTTPSSTLFMTSRIMSTTTTSITALMSEPADFAIDNPYGAGEILHKPDNQVMGAHEKTVDQSTYESSSSRNINLEKVDDHDFKNNLQMSKTSESSGVDAAVSKPLGKISSQNSGWLSSIDKSSEDVKSTSADVTDDDCSVDHRVKNCSLLKRCPEGAECRFGTCCKTKVFRCLSGLLALDLPETCNDDDKCPIGARCQNHRCCPLDISQFAQDQSLKEENSNALMMRTVKLSRCLAHRICSAISLCPPRFTCSLEGKCCRLETFCRDGTVPESECGADRLCPSSSHSCIRRAGHNVCCVSDGNLVHRDSPSLTVSNFPQQEILNMTNSFGIKKSHRFMGNVSVRKTSESSVLVSVTPTSDMLGPDTAALNTSETNSSGIKKSHMFMGNVSVRKTPQSSVPESDTRTSDIRPDTSALNTSESDTLESDDLGSDTLESDASVSRSTTGSQSTWLKGSCPIGSMEVNPRFGNFCRYSLQCPSPYYCNFRGKCCQPKNSTWL